MESQAANWACTWWTIHRRTARDCDSGTLPSQCGEHRDESRDTCPTEGAEEEAAAGDLPCGTTLRRASAVADWDPRGDAAVGTGISVGGRRHSSISQSASFAGLLGSGSDCALKRRHHAHGSAQREESELGTHVIHPGCAAPGGVLAGARTVLSGARATPGAWTSASCDFAKDLWDDAQDAAVQHSLPMEGGRVVPEEAQGLEKEQRSAGGIEDSRLTGIIVVVEADPLTPGRK